MQEQLISFKTAKLAKEKGFNLNSHAYYGCDNPSNGKANQLMLRTYEKWENFGKEDSPQEGTMIYSAPTQSLLQKWLREVHNLYVNPIEYITPQSKSVMYELSSKFYDNASVRLKETLSTKQESLFGLHNSYEECLEYGLFEALKLI